MNLRLYIDGTAVPASDVAELDNITITRRQRDATGAAAPSFSVGITVLGTTAADLLRRLVIDRTDEAIPARLVDECCTPEELLIEGDIRADGLTWCEGCDEVEVELTEKSPLSCLEYTYVFDGDIPNQQNPFVRYCTELRPSFVHDLLISISLLVMTTILPIMTVVGLIITAYNAAVSIINAVINALNTLTGGSIGNIPTIGQGISGFDEAFGLVQEIGKWAIGCRRGHTAYYLRDLAVDGCRQCNATFVSTVWNDVVVNPELWSTALMPRSVKKGRENYTSWREDNKPLKTVSALLDEMATSTNSVWWVDGGTVRLETKANIQAAQTPVVIDVADPDVKVCYEFDDEGVPARLEIEPTLDGIDWAGNEGKRYYQELVDYRIPPNPRLKGVKKVQLPFAPVRFRDDGVERDVQSFWAEFLGGGLASFMVSLPVIGSYFGSILGPFVDANKVYDRALLLPLETSEADKWLVIDQSTFYQNAKVVRVPRGGGNWHYNQALWVDSGQSAYPDKPGTGSVPNLYRFFAPDDPRTSPKLGINYTVELLNTCEARATFRPGVLIQLPSGVGLIDQVQISKNSLKLTGKI